LLFTQEAKIHRFFLISLEEATVVNSMTTAAEEIVENIVLENVLFDQICQPNIGHHR